MILSFAVFITTFFYLLFSDTASKSVDLVLGFFAFLSFYTAIDFFGYLRWRKKALAAAATGKFSRTGIPDKLLSSLLDIFLILCITIIIVKSIITADWGTLIIMTAIAVAMVIYHFLDKLKKKTNSNRKKRIISFVSFLIYAAAIVCVNYILDLF